jgi:hypothetical protein
MVKYFIPCGGEAYGMSTVACEGGNTEKLMTEPETGGVFALCGIRRLRGPLVLIRIPIQIRV